MWPDADPKIMIVDISGAQPPAILHRIANITRLTEISRAEPDPAVFGPPPDYKIVDQEGQFTIGTPRP